MCNETSRRLSLDELRHDWQQTRIPLRFPEGLPNMAPLESVRITDSSVIIRPSREDSGSAELVSRRWSWPGAHKRPVYNFRSEGREFGSAPTSGRCLIPVDGFYEFTEPPADAASGARKKPPKSKWRFTMRGVPWFCVAGLWRTQPDVGEAWTMLTTEPGPDIAPYHNRQIVVLGPSDWARWLDDSVPAREICRPAPAGTLDVQQVR